MIRICLAMIVKDEAPVIRRALESVKPYIASWVVCDTGSTDGTPAIVHETMAGVAGGLFYDEWVDFSHNRNLSLERARESGCDYTLLLDADEILDVESAAVFDGLDADAYIVRGYVDDRSWLAQRLIRTALPWRYVGVIHEALDCPSAESHILHQGITIATPQDGHRSQDPDKYEKDIRTMERALADEPTNTRYMFHLAMGYQLAGRFDQALEMFECRLQHGGQDTELWYSRYQLGRLHHRFAHRAAAAECFLECYADFPQAAEPLYWYARSLMEWGQYEAALPLLELASMKREPAPLFITETRIYTYEAKLYWALCLVRLNRLEDANGLLLALAQAGVLPDGAVDEAERTVLASYAERGVA